MQKKMTQFIWGNSQSSHTKSRTQVKKNKAKKLKKNYTTFQFLYLEIDLTYNLIFWVTFII